MGAFAAAGPLVGVLGARLVAVILTGGLDGGGRSWSGFFRSFGDFLSELSLILPLAYVLGAVPAALTGAAVGLARAYRPRLAWSLAAGIGLLSPLGLGAFIGVSELVILAAPVGLFAALICTALTSPLNPSSRAP